MLVPTAESGATPVNCCASPSGGSSREAGDEGECRITTSSGNRGNWRRSPSPVSCADILPRWGKNRIVRRVRNMVRIRRTVFVYRSVSAGRGQAAAPTQKPPAPPQGRPLVGRPKPSRAQGGPENRRTSNARPYACSVYRVGAAFGRRLFFRPFDQVTAVHPL